MMCVPFAQATARPAGGVAADGRDGATGRLEGRVRAHWPLPCVFSLPDVIAPSSCSTLSSN